MIQFAGEKHVMFTDLVEVLVTSQLWVNVKQLVLTTARVLLLTGSQTTPTGRPVGF